MKKILIVEDDPDIAAVTVARLQKAGYVARIAADGQQGLALASDYVPDLIFLDLDLPIMTGQELCITLKANERLKAVPVVVFSTHDRIEEVSKQIKADGYLRKPCGSDELIGIANQYTYPAA